MFWKHFVSMIRVVTFTVLFPALFYTLDTYCYISNENPFNVGKGRPNTNLDDNGYMDDLTVNHQKTLAPFFKIILYFELLLDSLDDWTIVLSDYY